MVNFKAAIMYVISVVLLLFLNAPLAQAEIMYGIAPYQTLGDIKKLFPSARLEPSNGPDQRKGAIVKKMPAPDLSGMLYLAFLDGRPGQKEIVKNAEKNIRDAEEISDPKKKDAEIKSIQTAIEYFRKEAMRPDDDALKIWYVTWVPNEPIPYQKYLAKYGEPEPFVLRIGDTKLYRFWLKRGVQVKLSDDETKVIFLENTFSADEELFYCKKKYDQNIWAQVCR